ncbi:MAG: HPr family phosphocarrier protein [Desulfovibrionaceae bacterium]
MDGSDKSFGNGEVRRQVKVSNQLGLHARPAARLAQEAQQFEADVSLVLDDAVVDAKSILDILTLAAPFGTALEIQAKGQDAPQAADQLEKLFHSRFGEER